MVNGVESDIKTPTEELKTVLKILNCRMKAHTFYISQ